MKRPDCWNRAEPTDPNAGWRCTGIAKSIETRDAFGQIVSIKMIYRFRYRHPWFAFRCTVHDKADIGPGLTYAQHHGWEEHCKTCRWYPAKVAA
jgi:hypothetical protein